jgi:uncharacterized protein with gpF-like domain
MPHEAKWLGRAPRYRRERGAARKGAAPGSTAHYVWRIDAADLSRTRPDHRRLAGKKFRWDDPPIVNSRTGERGNPGMDTHCRCWAEPVPDGDESR